MYTLGTILIISGIMAALLASVSYTLVTRGNTGALLYGRLGTRGALVAVLLIVGLLSYLFVMRRYDIKYVYDYSADNLEFFFRVAAMWAGQPGSFVVWALWGIIAAQLLVRRTRHTEPYVLSVFMLIQAALLFYMLIRNPFIPYTDASGALSTPADGKGLNELLHNPWMIIHPPILFVGYALLAVPFAFAVAGLWRRDYDGWIQRALPWTLAGWAFLGTALLLGGYWAYETLGWGGYWGWDPVENSALVPWLTATALVHGLLIQRTHGGLRRTNFVLAIGTYMLVFYATFLTRSGVLSSFSVHSFVEEGLKWIMIGSLVTLVVASIAVLAWRWRDIPTRPLSEKLLSRDSFFVLGIISLVVIASVVCLGTSMPVISAIPGVGSALQSIFATFFTVDNGTFYNQGGTPFTDGRFGLVGSFYSATVPPLGLILILLMIVGPLLGWRDSNPRHLLRTLLWPAVAAVVITCGKIVLVSLNREPINPQGLAYVGLASFAIGTNLVMIVRTVRGGGVLKLGGYLAHVGLAILLVGAVASTTYATPDQKLVIPENDTITAYGYTFAFNGWRMTPAGKGLLDITVRKGDDSFSAAPLLYFNPRMGATMATPSIKNELFQDLYISPVEFQPANDRNTAQFGTNDTHAIGPYSVTFLGFDANQAHQATSADIGAQVKVVYQGQELQLTPKLRINANETDPNRAVQSVPENLPGGTMIALENFDPLQRKVMLRITGLSLPVDPAKAVVNVSVKPGISMVWGGVIIGMIGGLLALVRRTLEGRARLGGEPSPLPRRLGGLVRGLGLRFSRRQTPKGVSGD